MLFYLMEGDTHTLENCIHFLQIRKSAIYNYCNELKAAGFDVRQKDAMRSELQLKQKLMVFVNPDQNHDNQRLIDALDIQTCQV